MIVGYARTSTVEQQAGFEAQHRMLSAAGCERVFSEQVSSVAEREQLTAALSFVRDGDVLMVTKLDRLARSMRDLVRIVSALEEKNVTLRILDMNLDTGTPTGRLMLNVLGSVAEFERSMMLERQREGIERARSEGKYKGRAPTARNKSEEILSLLEGGVSPSEVARRLCVGRSSVYRVMRAASPKPVTSCGADESKT